METFTQIDPAQHHIRALFSAKSANAGGIIRRNIRWADREIGRDRLISEVKRRGFHMVTCGGQYVIICDQGFLQVVC